MTRVAAEEARGAVGVMGVLVCSAVLLDARGQEASENERSGVGSRGRRTRARGAGVALARCGSTAARMTP